MISNPRTSNEPHVRRALGIWDQANEAPDEANREATALRKQLRLTNHHQAYGWAVATNGRVAAYRGQIDLAESLLCEGLGHFAFVEDTYGRIVITSHLAIPQVLRGNYDRGLELALEPLHSGAMLASSDLALVQNIAAMCHWERDEFSAAIFHLNSQFAIVKKIGSEHRLLVLRANIGSLLINLGEFERAREVLLDAWNLSRARHTDGGAVGHIALSNLIFAAVQLNRIGEASELAETLIRHLPGQPSHSIPKRTYANLAEALARADKIQEAKVYLRLSRSVRDNSASARLEYDVSGTEAVILEMSGKLHEAINAAQQLLTSESKAQPQAIYRRQAAATLARCHAKLGDKENADYWTRYEKDVGRDDLLGEVLANQLRANFQLEEPSQVVLTEKELSCLRLSANGQTSTDIGLKLGITPRTVNFHFSKILRKLNAMNRQEAIAKAASANLLR